MLRVIGVENDTHILQDEDTLAITKAGVSQCVKLIWTGTNIRGIDVVPSGLVYELQSPILPTNLSKLSDSVKFIGLEMLKRGYNIPQAVIRISRLTDTISDKIASNISVMHNIKPCFSSEVGNSEKSYKISKKLRVCPNLTILKASEHTRVVEVIMDIDESLITGYFNYTIMQKIDEIILIGGNKLI